VRESGFWARHVERLGTGCPTICPQPVPVSP